MRFLHALAASSFALCALALQDLPSLLKSQTNLSSFDALLQSYPNFYKNFSSTSNITIFAPSNAAFDQLNYTVLGPAFASDNTDAVRELLFYHVAPGLHPSSSFTPNFRFLPTLLTNRTYTNVTGGQVIAVVEQAGNVSIAVSGLGVRATLTTVVNFPSEQQHRL